jgi:hypothetical protein
MRKIHDQDNGNHCPHQKDNQQIVWQTQKPLHPRQKATCEGWPRHVICKNQHKSSIIIRPSNHLQQQFILTRSMTKWTTLQVLCIRCKLFESTNVIIRHCCVQINAMFSQLLQSNVMQIFYQIISGHVYQFFIIELLHIKGKETLEKSKMSQWRWR